MSKIENHSIFGSYSQNENRVTAALLQILKIGGTEFISDFIASIEEVEFPSKEINITTQTGEENNVYDGLLECDFSFRIFIESKIGNNKVDKKQLNGLIQNAQLHPKTYIIYITSDSKKPQILKDKVNDVERLFWINWKRVNDILKNEIVKPESEVLSFLITEFEKLLEEFNLLDKPEERVQIAAGGFGENIAEKYLFYACQNERSSKESGYLAFYHKKAIKSLFKIENVKDNTDLNEEAKNNEKVAQYLKERDTTYRGDRRKFYLLRKVIPEDIGKKELPQINIIHKGEGRGKAYTMGVYRYTTIDKFLKAETTTDL
ncbi:hypothetical protein JMN12_13840 [Capnocytophaga genosp. AHN8471]|jgi:hypothetical protein|uniref:hypothetical protein n=1 Tax=Capnocytophaga genosp. AHN8471 TaxID=327574 RepID=UPI001933B61D|nr:hypothetical protein [Capnocytophaga genosp. AHN8471]MBM0657604.1 hypothetical protein [Capnocytophaga genosp. AHN8471]